MMDTPEMVKIRAIDVKPYHYFLWCRIGNGEPFANEIVYRKWSDDGKRIVFGLETHNYYFAEPDEMMELIPVKLGTRSAETMAERDARDAERMARPAQKWEPQGEDA